MYHHNTEQRAQDQRQQETRQDGGGGQTPSDSAQQQTAVSDLLPQLLREEFIREYRARLNTETKLTKGVDLFQARHSQWAGATE